MPSYFVTWLEQSCMGAHVEADTPAQAVSMVREGDCEAKLQGCESEGDICVDLDGERVHTEKS